MDFSTVPCNEFVEVSGFQSTGSGRWRCICTGWCNRHSSWKYGRKPDSRKEKNMRNVEEEMQELKAKCDVLQKELLTSGRERCGSI